MVDKRLVGDPHQLAVGPYLRHREKMLHVTNENILKLTISSLQNGSLISLINLA